MFLLSFFLYINIYIYICIYILKVCTGIKLTLNIEGAYAVIEKVNHLNPIALRVAKTLQSFGCSECNMVKP